jgi:biotin transport system substrate-specific component
MSTLAANVRTWVVRDVVIDPRARATVGVVAFALATAFGAQVAIPLPGTPVPITLQTLFVVLAGVVLGPRLGALAVAGYVLLGAAGAPVFAGGGAGLPWLLGPTGGYLLAAPAAAFIAGWVAGPGRSAPRTLTGLACGVLTMYAGGVSWLYLLTGESLTGLLALGVFPFVAGDAVKVLAAFWIARGARRTSFARF